MRLFRVDNSAGGGKKWRFMERFEVPSLERPLEAHFVRYRLIQTPWFGIYVHRFDNPDVRTFHDHPWNFTSVVLRGAYVEVVQKDGQRYARKLGRGSRRVNRKMAEDLHFIETLLRKPTWTLIVVGRRRRVWGYVDEDGWTRFDQHENARKFDRAMAMRARWDYARGRL